MQKHRLGSTDIIVSALGLGTVKFGRTEGLKYPHPFTLPTDQEIANLLAYASELGINLLDTAPAYGNSEERLGKILGKNRQQWIIATKAGEEFIKDQSEFDFSEKTIQKSLERSLKRLKTDYLDIVLIHSNGEDEKIIKEDLVFATLEKYKQLGWIRAYGMSTKTITGGLLTIEQADLAMVTYRPDYIEERIIIEKAHQLQKGILIKKGLASGHLPMPAGQGAKQSLQFILKEPGVSSVIVGTINPSHLQENVAALI